MAEKISLSVIIPVFNEEKSILTVIANLKNELQKIDIKYEIITINDGSSDESLKLLKTTDNIKIINHEYNKGYGASLKAGIKKADNDWVLFFDADGQHMAEDIKRFIPYTDDYDIITGDRSNSKYVRPAVRKPGIWLLNTIANYLVKYKIPDLNCGFRLINKKQIKQYLHIMPDGFSMSTTSTLAFLKDKKNIKFVPIEINKRAENSKSSVKPIDALITLMLIFRLIMLFSPLRIFFPVSLLLFLIGSSSLIYNLCILDISESTVFVLITAILIFFFGLIADQISALRRDIFKN